MLNLVTSTWRETVRTARQRNLAPYTALVVAMWFVVGLALLLTMAREIAFPAATHPSAVGWVTVHQYPKYQDYLYFALAVWGVPAVCVVGWLSWVTAAAHFSESHERALKQLALGHLAWLIVLPRLLRLAPATGQVLLSAVVLQLLWAGACRFLIPGTASHPARPDDGAPPERKADPPRGWSRPLRIIRGCVLLGLVPAAIYLLRYDPVIDGDVDLFHDGEFLVPLNEMLHGGIPYRDIYLQHGLFQNALIPWLGAQIFEPTLAGVRSMQHLVEPLSSVALYFFALFLFRGRGLTVLLIALFVASMDPHVPVRLTLGLLALACILAAIPHCRRWPVLLAGVFTALAFWHSVEVGLFTGAAISIFLACGGLNSRDAWRWYATGLAGGLAAFGWYFLIHGALDDLVRNVYIQCVHQTEAWGLPGPNFFETVGPLLRDPIKMALMVPLLIYDVLFYLPPAVFMIAAGYLTYRFVRGDWRSSPHVRTLLLVVLAGTFYFRSVLGRNDGFHLGYGLVFLMMLMLYLSNHLLARTLRNIRRPGLPKRLRALYSLPVVFAAFVTLWMWIYFTLMFNQHPWQNLTTRAHRVLHPPPATSATAVAVERAGLMVLPSWQVQYIQAVNTAIHDRTAPTDRVFDFTNQAGLLFFADRRSATRYFHVVYAVTPDMQEEIVSALDAQKPLAILTVGPLTPYTEAFDDVPQSERTPIIRDHLAAHYQRVALPGTPIVMGNWTNTPMALQ